jgi:hypothetical protein
MEKQLTTALAITNLEKNLMGVPFLSGASFRPVLFRRGLTANVTAMSPASMIPQDGANQQVIREESG